MKLRKVFHLTITTIFYVWLAAQFLSWTEPLEKTTAPKLAKQIEKMWIGLKEKNLLHGTIIIKEGSQIVFSDGDLDQTYSIASVSKSFVGFKYFALSHQGLDLNTPVCHWLKNFCVQGLSQITLQQLLTHKSGFAKDLSFTHFVKRMVQPDWDISRIDALTLSENSLEAPPGEEFIYSNFGFLVLSRVLEIIERKPFSQIVQQLAQKAGLTKTSAIVVEDVFPIFSLLPLTKTSAALHAKTILYRSAGTGGIKSSAADLIKWLEFLEANNFQSVFSESKESYSHGFVRSKNQSYQAFWHNGAALGSYSLIATIPQSALTIVVLTDNFKFAKQWSIMAEQFENYFY